MGDIVGLAGHIRSDAGKSYWLLSVVISSPTPPRARGSEPVVGMETLCEPSCLGIIL